MSESSTQPPAPASATTAPVAAPAPTAPTPPKVPPKPENPALRMLGLPKLPKKLPSRNWLIFWAVTATFTSAIIYDKREKNRATAKWRRAVAPLADELLPSATQLPRKLTIYLESPPGDSIRVAQDHFIEYVKPVLSSSGLDWEFVQGRQQGDVRAAVAEKIRMTRRTTERPDEELPQTDETLLATMRKRMNVPEYEGVKGDIVVGRHTWKEYMRGLHEGWLGPLDAPAPPVVEEKPSLPEPTPVVENPSADGEATEEKKEEPKKEEKPTRPPQPIPHNTPDDYTSAVVPAQIPAEFSPSAPIAFPHRLGFRHTFVRLGWFLNRRKLADDIGREVAAACFAAARDFRSADGQYEQELVLQHEESDWPKSVWKPEVPEKDEDGNEKPIPFKEKIWTSPIVTDDRIVTRMRRFEMQPEDEARAAKVVVPEEEVEGWIKGSLRSMWRWGASSLASKPKGPNVGNLDDE